MLLTEELMLQLKLKMGTRMKITSLKNLLTPKTSAQASIDDLPITIYQIETANVVNNREYPNVILFNILHIN